MKACAFVSVATMSALGLLFFACGGEKPPAKTEPGTSTATGAAPASSAPTSDSPPSTTLAVGAASSGTKLDPTTPPAAAGGDDKKDGGGGGKKGSEPGRSHEDIRVLVMAHREEARACYDNALAAHPGIEGDVKMKFTIDPEGNVSEIGLDPQGSTILEPSVASCIGDVIKKIKFAKSSKGFETHGHYPFNFHPRANQGRKDAGS
jgi:outer membrane biosynthesis protein TonB